MTEFLSYQTITFMIGLAGIGFGIYKYFRDPDIAADKRDAIMELKIETIEKSLMLLLTNHIPHLETRIVDIHEDVSQLKQLVGKLEVIIDERIPRKT